MDRNFNPKIRKPRQTKGTPLHTHRNIFALGVIVFSGISWYLFELWPRAQVFKKKLLTAVEDSPETKEKFLRARLSMTNPAYDQALSKLQLIKAEKEDAEFEEQTKEAPCSPNPDKISKYFRPLQSHSEGSIDTDAMSSNSSSLTPEKPQKPSISNTSYNDENDFSTPVAINKVSKLIKLKPPLPKQNPKKSKPLQRTTLRKTKSASALCKDIRTFTDTNPDHLQLALALSESTYEAENNCPVIKTDSNDKMEAFKQALEKFGFQCNMKKIDGTGTGRKEQIVKKLDKKSRYRHITPILYIRNEKDRQAIISTRINRILSENIADDVPVLVDTDEPLFSEFLENLKSNVKIWKINSLSIEELNNEIFYVRKINFSPSRAKCGHLLKDWSKIAGRESTPLRENNKLSCDNLRDSLCVSPDLFGSDDENSVERKSLKRQRESDNNHSSKRLSFDLNSLSENSESNKEPIDILVEVIHELEDGAKQIVASVDNGDEAIFVDLTQSSSDSGNESDKMYKNTEHSQNDLSLSEDSGDETVILSEEQRLEDIASLPQIHAFAPDTPLKTSEYTNNFENNLLSVDCDKKHESLDYSKISFNESKKIFEAASSTFNEATHLTKDLNVTSYINHILNDEYTEENKIDLTQSDDDENDQNSGNQADGNEIPINSSQNSNSQESIIISDDELNYSSIYSTPNHKKIIVKKTIYQLSDNDDDITPPSSPKRLLLSPVAELDLPDKSIDNLENNSPIPHYAQDEDIMFLYEPESPRFLEKDPTLNTVQSPKLDHNDENEVRPLESSESPVLLSPVKTPIQNNLNSESPKSLNNEENLIVTNSEKTPSIEQSISKDSTKFTTPTPNEYIIKQTDVTPMVDYDSMSTPKIVEELKKIGVKPLKRKKGAKFLKYIYEVTHPLASPSGSNLEPQPSQSNKNISIVGDIVTEKEIENDELIFEKVQSKKIHSCRIPLQIVWYNFVSCNPDIRQNILLYEPLQLEVIHSMLKEQGYKFNIKDLLTFLDKKCITIRTAQGNAQGRRRY